MFWFCNHDWISDGTITKIGFWRNKTTAYHKCSKCGKREQCDKNDSIRGGSQHSGETICSKCGQYNQYN